jgi:DNA helicase-2/ATP-dependent DNA helicase PcrA
MLNLDILNPPQRDAVTTTEGAVLVLAGAGSGKTRVLTYRIAYILEQRLAYPEQILAVTFTNKAAGEMKERIGHLLAADSLNPNALPKLPWMGTFHSICVKILRQQGHHLGLDNNFTIYDPGDQLDAVKTAMEQLNISTKDVNPRAVLSMISSAKNQLVAADDYAKYAQGYFQQTVAEIYPKYQNILKQNNCVDFDDLLVLVVKLLQDYPEVRQKYQELFKYILVDEYQDTNHVQYMMMKLLADKHRNICVVGDDDQSIYSFRGANIQNILNFERDYSDAKVIKLEQNYRSTKIILDAAYEVVKKNKNRTAKKLWTDQDGGDKIILFTAADERDEARWTVGKIKALEQKGESLDDMAVLYRTNAQSRSLEEEFLRQAVAYKVVGGVRFYERKEIKDVLAYLQVLYNPRNDAGVLRIINIPRRGIGPKAIADVQAAAQQMGLSIVDYLHKYGHTIGNKKILEFAQLVQYLKNKASELHLVDLINMVLERTEYIKSLQDGTSENEARIENIKELLSVANKYQELAPAAGLMAFLEEIALLEDISAKNQNGKAVTLMTVHAAKGLEFKHVFVVGMEEGLFPHSRVYTEPNELEEERRLAYVAITRAKKILYMIHAESRLFFGNRQSNMVSRFIDDIPRNLITLETSNIRRDQWESGWETDWDDGWQNNPTVDLKPGDKVQHEYFGRGEVLALTDSTIKIRFAAAFGTKELARDLAPVRKV